MLLAVGVLNAFFCLLVLVFAVLKVPSPFTPAGQPPATIPMSTAVLWWAAAVFICAAVTIWGSLNAMRLRGYALSIVGSLTASFPLAPAFCVGVIIALWMFLTLLRPEVRKSFTAT
jgi:hypothetical protein